MVRAAWTDVVAITVRPEVTSPLGWDTSDVRGGTVVQLILRLRLVDMASSRIIIAMVGELPLLHVDEPSAPPGN
jgi:hypothetical protein